MQWVPHKTMDDRPLSFIGTVHIRPNPGSFWISHKKSDFDFFQIEYRYFTENNLLFINLQNNLASGLSFELTVTA